jgi:hypothetical protein
VCGKDPVRHDCPAVQSRSCTRRRPVRSGSTYLHNGPPVGIEEWVSRVNGTDTTVSLGLTVNGMEWNGTAGPRSTGPSVFLVSPRVSIASHPASCSAPLPPELHPDGLAVDSPSPMYRAGPHHRGCRHKWIAEWVGAHCHASLLQSG